MQGCIIQCLVTYKYTDNFIRTKVSTIILPFLREVQFKELITGFD
jgi:hypothetical protein